MKTVSSMLGHYSAGFMPGLIPALKMQQATADTVGGFLENALPDENVPEPELSKGKIIPFEQMG